VAVDGGNDYVSFLVSSNYGAESIEIIRQSIGTKIYWHSVQIFSWDSLHTGNSYFIKMNQEGVIGF
jgi:hypothetical protein